MSKLASIEISSRGSDTRIGANSVIDDFVKIKHVGGIGGITIGEKVYINSGCVLYSGNGLKIGNHVLIGPNCSITPVNHSFMNKDTLIVEQGFMESKGGVIIEDDVWIGSNVTVLDGAIIRRGAVIGANSLVNSEIEPYSISYGSPCKTKRYRK
ncbi:MAG: acyltransferase [Sulfurovum sp.]|nr:acyltransferase [Sulfurovum sp.]